MAVKKKTRAAPRKKPAARPPSKPRALSLAVTGCETLVGARVLQDLGAIGNVERAVVFDVQPPATTDPRVLYHQLDLTQPGADAEMVEVMREYDTNVFLHAAFLWNTVRDLEWAHELESVGTDRVLAAVLSAGVSRFVMTSSVSVYGITHRNATPLSEDSPLVSARTLPPWSDKVDAETAVARFAESHPDICVTVIRSALVLDPMIDRAISRTMRKGFLPGLMGFDPLFQFIHPDDLLKIYRLALTESHPGAFNITTEDAIALSDLVRLGSKVSIQVPHVVALPGYRLLWTAGIGDIHWSFLNFLRFSLITDGTRAKEEFGVAPARSSLDTVLEFYGRGQERE